MGRIVCLSLLISGFLAAEESPPYSLVDYLRSPIPRAAGFVNVISGDWIDQESHCQTSGPDPYVVAHSYCSTNAEEGTLADGWDFFHPAELEVHQPGGITYNEKGPKPTAEPLDSEPPSIEPPTLLEKGRHHHHHRKRVFQPQPDPATLFYREAGGSTVVFETDCIIQGFHPKLEGVGYSVVSSIDQPVRRTAERTHVNWESSNDTWIVELGDRTKRIYSRVDKHRHRPNLYQETYYKRLYHIQEERLPSGNARCFYYGADKELSRIDTLSSDKTLLISSVDFHRYKDHVDVVASDGLTTTFHFKNLHDRESARVVRAVDRPGLGRLYYEYSKNNKLSRRLHARTTAGRPDIPNYFHAEKGKKNLAFSVGRIRRVRTKDFSGHSLETSHSSSGSEVHLNTPV